MLVSYSDAFKRQLRRLSRKYHRIRSDVQPIITQLEDGVTPGVQIQGTGYTVYKVRVRNSDAKRGKSGGYRMIYYLPTQESVLLVSIYSKTEQSDIDDAEVARIISENGEES